MTARAVELRGKTASGHASLLLEIDGDPIPAAWDCGKGRSPAVAPDAAPHGAARVLERGESRLSGRKPSARRVAGVSLRVLTVRRLEPEVSVNGTTKS